MKPTDPTPEEYVNWIKTILVDYYLSDLPKTNKLTETIINEIFDNCKEGINRLYFNECLTELKKL